jgi:hypothetical protein
MSNHHNNKIWLLAGMALILVILPLMVTACDAVLKAEGTVYEWIDAPAGSDSEMYINTAAPAGRMIKPVANASVSFSIYSADNPRVTTSANGTFSWNGLFAPKSTLDIKVEKEGYRAIKKQFRRDDVLYSFVIFLVREPTALDPSTSVQESQETIDLSSYVFIEHYISTYGEPIVGKYPFMFIDFPLYSFSEKTGTLNAKWPNWEINDSLKAVLGDGSGLSGCAGSGMSTSVYGVYDLPYERNNLKILEIESDGTVHLSYNSLSIVLKSGEKWSNVKSFIDTKENDGATAKAKLTTTDTIVNYGLLDKSKIIVSK